MKDPKRNELKERIGPGLWVDQNDHLHISLTEILEHHDLPATPENMTRVREMAIEMIKDKYPNAEFVDRRTPED